MFKILFLFYVKFFEGFVLLFYFGSMALWFSEIKEGASYVAEERAVLVL